MSTSEKLALVVSPVVMKVAPFEGSQRISTVPVFLEPSSRMTPLVKASCPTSLPSTRPEMLTPCSASPFLHVSTSNDKFSVTPGLPAIPSSA